MTGEEHEARELATQGAAPPEVGRPKRLPVLWIICVLFGLGGMFSLTAAFSATALGAVTYAAFAALDFALALMLWLRLRAGWYLVMLVLAVNLCYQTVPGLLGANPNVLRIIAPCVVTFLYAYYLWARRRYFGQAGVRRPRLLSRSGIAAGAVVLVFGGGFLLLMTVDDARRSFPALEARVPVPAEGENGYLLVEEMRSKWPLAEDEQFDRADDAMPRGGETPGPEWVQEARAVVERYSDCLGEARELVKKPHFVQVPQKHGMEWVENSMDWVSYVRALARLQAMSARLQAADNRWSPALDEANGVLELGVLVGKESTSIMQTLVGIVVTRMGLHGLREVAAKVPDPALLRAHLRPVVPEAELRKGFNLGLAGEFQGHIGMLEAIRTGGPDAWFARGAKSRGFLVGQMNEMPLIKTNMTYNLFGGLMSAYVIEGDTFTAPRKSELMEASSVRGIVRTLGWLQFVRNPVGDMLIVMMVPAVDRLASEYFVAAAEARLTQVFLGLRCYQLEYGRLPEALDELAPAYIESVPLDPFTEAPFVYEPAAAPPRILSVGPDQKPDPPDAKDKDDIVVELSFSSP